MSFVAAAAVIIRGVYLVWQFISGAGLQGHDAPLGALMDYVVYFGSIASADPGFGIAGKTRLGILGNLAYLVFIAGIYLID